MHHLSVGHQMCIWKFYVSKLYKTVKFSEPGCRGKYVSLRSEFGNIGIIT